MNILVDVNVFEDIFRQRLGWETSLAVVGCVRKTRGEKAARQAVQGILHESAVVSLGEEALEAAYESPLLDFEDALQLEAAKAAKVDAIVTRNKRHFRQKQIEVLSPEELVERAGLTQGPR